MKLGGPARCEKSGTTGSTAVSGNPSASSSARLYSESPSPRLDPRRVGRQLTASQVAELHQQRVHVDEELRRRDVVVDQRHPVGQREGHPRGPRSDREMVDQQVVGMAGVRQIAIVGGQMLEPAIRRLHENLRGVAGGPEHALDPQHLVADRVAVAERREHLVHLRRHRGSGPLLARGPRGARPRRIRPRPPGLADSRCGSTLSGRRRRRLAPGASRRRRGRGVRAPGGPDDPAALRRRAASAVRRGPGCRPGSRAEPSRRARGRAGRRVGGRSSAFHADDRLCGRLRPDGTRRQAGEHLARRRQRPLAPPPPSGNRLHRASGPVGRRLA